MRSEGEAHRDVEWVCDDPAYRVHFWRQPAPDRGGAADGAPGEAAWQCFEHRLAGVADVREVIAWADERVQEGDQYAVYVEQRDAGRPGLIRVAGFDPTASAFHATSA